MSIVYLYSDLDNTNDDLLEMEPVHRRPLVIIRTMIVTTSFERRTGVEKPKLREIMEVTIFDVEAVAEIEFDGVAPGAELVVEGVGELVDEARFDIDSEGYADWDGVIDAVTPSVFVVVGVPLPVLLEDGVGVSDAVDVCEGDSVGVLEAVTPLVSELVGECVGVGDDEGVLVLEGVPVEENEGVTVAVGVLSGVPPKVSVVVVVLVDDLVGVPVDDGVFVVVPDRDDVGVLVGDPVMDGV